MTIDPGDAGESTYELVTVEDWPSAPRKVYMEVRRYLLDLALLHFVMAIIYNGQLLSLKVGLFGRNGRRECDE